MGEIVRFGGDKTVVNRVGDRPRRQPSGDFLNRVVGKDGIATTALNGDTSGGGIHRMGVGFVGRGIVGGIDRQRHVRGAVELVAINGEAGNKAPDGDGTSRVWNHAPRLRQHQRFAINRFDAPALPKPTPIHNGKH